MEKLSEAAVVIMFCAVCFTFIMWSLISGLSKDEIVECNKWQTQATQYSGFYLTQWQSDQCKSHNITIDAPVK